MKNSCKLLLCLCTAALLIACGDASTDDSDVTTASIDTAPETTAAETEFRYTDNLGEMSFGGAEYRVRTIENLNVTSYMNVEEQTGDTLDDAIYLRNRAIEERFDITFVETIVEDGAGLLKNIITAGDDAFELCNLRCTDALTFWEDNLIYNLSEVPHLNLSQPYWANKLNRSITLGGEQYTAVGAYDVNVMDLSYALIFNKELLSQNDLTSPYDLVKDGTWTMDAMLGMMTEVANDINGDGKMDEADQWGYIATAKNVLPSFWIAAGELSIVKDENDCPHINMTAERFVNVVNKTYAHTWDSDAWLYIETPHDVPDENIKIFSEGRSLFMDVSLFHLEQLRDMEADFGIIPYPKYEDSQAEYYSRVSYYWATVVPTTNGHLDMTGAILEALNCESANTVTPAYYDVALKTKVSRDEESAAMLDLILENRVVDIGDTILCADIRDGFVYSMFKSNKRELVSTVQKHEKTLQKIFDKMPIWD